MSVLHAARTTTLSRHERSEVTADLLARCAATVPGDDGAEERAALHARVVEVNLRVAHAVASRYRNRGVALEDLEQAAGEGLVKAVQRFDPEFHRDLLSYAVPTIRGEVMRHFRDRSWTVRPPRRIQELQQRLGEVEAELGRAGDDAVDDDAVCARLEITRGELDEVRQAFGCFNPPSLDQPVGGPDGAPLLLGDSIADPDSPEVAAEARAMLKPIMRHLGERDRRVLFLRFWADQTQAEIGVEFGLSQVQVSRWLSRVLVELREGLESDVSPAAVAAPSRGA